MHTNIVVAPPLPSQQDTYAAAMTAAGLLN
eukprot:SAG31_NODE_17601_length_665_cov_0.556537_1_plen_29_part_10